MKQYYTEETAKKLVKIGFYETVQYFKIKDKIYPKLPEPDELVVWLREHMNTYIVVMPDISKPLGHRFKYFVYTNDGCVVEGAHFNYYDATIYAIVEYLYKDEL